ncbi:hypothetical protein ACTQ1U_07205 [Thermoguttaceae bacterium LCP21S3_D4]
MRTTKKGKKCVLLLTFLLAGSLLLSGCKKEDETVEDTQQPEIGGEESVDMQYVDEEDTQSPFYFSLEQQSILPLLDVVMEYQNGSVTLAYPADSAESYWNYLVTALIKYSYLREADGSITRNEDGTLTVKKYVVEEFAQAMFAADSSVPEIPASLSDTAIRYENESKSYIIDKGAFQLPYGENTTVQAQLDDWIAQDDGSYLVTASLLTYSDAEGSRNTTFRFILNENGYKDELPDPLFYYAISSVSPMDGSFSDPTQETEENSLGQEPSTQTASE